VRSGTVQCGIAGERPACLALVAFCCSPCHFIKSITFQGDITMIHFRKLSVAATLALSMLAIAPVSQAADAYPSQPVKLLVPFPPGGGTDTMARFVANALTEKFKWNVVVENRPGAGGTVGLGVLSRSAPNGYNMALGQTSNLSINPYLYSNRSEERRVGKDV